MLQDTRLINKNQYLSYVAAMNKWNFKSNTLPLAPQKMKICTDLYEKTYKTLMSKIKEELINGELFHVHE